MAEYEKLPEGYNIDQRIEQSRQQQRETDRAGYEQLPQGYRLPGTEPTAYEKDWGAAPWKEVLKSGAKELPESVGRGIMAIPQAIMNPSETAAGFKQLGTGIASKVRGAMGAEQAPEQKAQDEAVINAVIEPFTSVAGFKKALATDPYSVLSVMALPVSGGASAAGAGAKAVGTASLAGKALRGAELAGKGAAMAMDPLYGAVKGVGAAYEYGAKPALKSAAAAQAGVPKASLELAYEAGKTPNAALKDAFNTFAKGQGKAEDFSQAVAKASTQMRNAEITDWAADKSNVLALKQVVPAQPVMDAIQEARTMIGPRNLAIGPAADAHAKLDQLERMMANRFRAPVPSKARTLEGFDQLKRTLYEMGEREPSGMVSDAIKKVNAGVRDAMGAVSPQYVELMEKYQLLNDKLKTIKKSLATGDNVSAVRELNAFIRGMDDVEKGRFIAELAKYDPRIPYMVAGASLNQAAGHPSNWSKTLTFGQLANLGAGVYSGNPTHMMGAIGGMAAQRLFLNPEAIGAGAYTAGKIAKGAEKVGEFIPPGTGATMAGAARIMPAGLSRMQNEELMDSVREGRATGGRVATADKLVGMVDRAKKNINNQTEELLKTPDSHVAQALEVANRHLEG
jgi:hypothetical protein